MPNLSYRDQQTHIEFPPQCFSGRVLVAFGVQQCSWCSPALCKAGHTCGIAGAPAPAACSLASPWQTGGAKLAHTHSILLCIICFTHNLQEDCGLLAWCNFVSPKMNCWSRRHRSWPIYLLSHWKLWHWRGIVLEIFSISSLTPLSFFCRLPLQIKNYQVVLWMSKSLLVASWLTLRFLHAAIKMYLAFHQYSWCPIFCPTWQLLHQPNLSNGSVCHTS